MSGRMAQLLGTTGWLVLAPAVSPSHQPSKFAALAWLASWLIGPVCTGHFDGTRGKCWSPFPSQRRPLAVGARRLAQLGLDSRSGTIICRPLHLHGRSGALEWATEKKSWRRRYR